MEMEKKQDSDKQCSVLKPEFYLRKSVVKLLQYLKMRSLKEIHFILPTASDVDNSDVLHDNIQLVDGNLGIQKDLIKLIYKFYYNQVLSTDSCDALPLVLLGNPNTTTLWNKRKVEIQAGLLTLDEERHFTQLVALLHPKCPVVYEQRRWLLSQCHDMTSDLIAMELELSLRTADRYKHNYYSWSHRQYCISKYAHTQMIREDLALIRKWGETHISEFSAFHHRLFLLKLLSYREEDLMNEYDDITQLLAYYSDHESLWLHRRQVVLHLAEKYSSTKISTLLEKELNMNAKSYHEIKYLQGLLFIIKQ